MTAFEAERTGTLFWDLKTSLLEYIQALPDGVVDGKLSERGFEFPGALGVDGIFRFVGALHLTAHGGELDVSVLDPWIEHDGERGYLSALTSPTTSERTRLAALGPTRIDESTITIDDVALTHDGAQLFAGQYRAYTRMSPLIIARG